MLVDDAWPITTHRHPTKMNVNKINGKLDFPSRVVTISSNASFNYIRP